MFGYVLKCDNCGRTFGESDVKEMQIHDTKESYILQSDAIELLDLALDLGWRLVDTKDYCPLCAKIVSVNKKE